MTVLIVGDAPSKFNTDPAQAFIGARCYPRLISWIKSMGIQDYKLINSHTVELLQEVSSWKGPIIALRIKAQNRLNQGGIQRFCLPHPSGLNRQINNKPLIQAELTAIRLYLIGVAYETK